MGVVPTAVAVTEIAPHDSDSEGHRGGPGPNDVTPIVSPSLVQVPVAQRETAASRMSGAAGADSDGAEVLSLELEGTRT